MAITLPDVRFRVNSRRRPAMESLGKVCDGALKPRATLLTQLKLADAPATQISREDAPYIAIIQLPSDPMTSIDVEFPPVPQLSPADEIQVRQALRRNRLLATGLLALMIVIAIATRFVPSPGWLVQLVRAGAEAGIIGGLADWFAITVLFRHPFGIPLPHTAILPSNKDRIGRSLGSFVERNFLVPEVILPKMHQADLTGK